MNTYIWCDDNVYEFEYRFAVAMANTLEEAIANLIKDIEEKTVNNIAETTSNYKKWTIEHPEFKLQYIAQLAKATLYYNTDKKRLINAINETNPTILTDGEADVIDHANY